MQSITPQTKLIAVRYRNSSEYPSIRLDQIFFFTQRKEKIALSKLWPK
ncbi:hypothetical protein N430_04525 [Pseudomonas sp. CC120222-01a]|nr:hypothetical protein N430_04525 [Pseudomonas sp. CC120222-01a]